MQMREVSQSIVYTYTKAIHRGDHGVEEKENEPKAEIIDTCLKCFPSLDFILQL